MPIYKVAISGSSDKPRIVRAETAARARDHVVTTESIKAEELADLMEAGATIETVPPAPAKPAEEAQAAATSEPLVPTPEPIVEADATSPATTA